MLGLPAVRIPGWAKAIAAGLFLRAIVRKCTRTSRALKEGNGVPLGKNSLAEQTSSAADELRRAVARIGNVDRVLELSGEPPTDRFIERWLAAKRYNVEEAVSAICAHAEWRAGYIACGRIHEHEIAQELTSQKAGLQGLDHQGNAVIVVLASRHNMQSRNLEETKRFICYVLDNAGALADQAAGTGKVSVIFDLSGLKLSNLDAKALGAIFELLQQHYPGRLAVLWFINAPLIFYGIWKVVCPFIQPSTRAKIQFTSVSKGANPLKDAVPAEVLPQTYGGSGCFVPIEEAVANAAATRPQKPQHDNVLVQRSTPRWRLFASGTTQAGVGWVSGRVRPWLTASTTILARLSNRVTLSALLLQAAMYLSVVSWSSKLQFRGWSGPQRRQTGDDPLDAPPATKARKLAATVRGWAAAVARTASSAWRLPLRRGRGAKNLRSHPLPCQPSSHPLPCQPMSHPLPRSFVRQVEAESLRSDNGESGAAYALSAGSKADSYAMQLAAPLRVVVSPVGLIILAATAVWVLLPSGVVASISDKGFESYDSGTGLVTAGVR